MNPLSLLGFLAFLVVATLVGIRLLLLWRRTRQTPELLMGIGVLGIGPVGFGAMTIGAVSTSNPALANTAYGFGTLAVAIGVMAKCVFNWLVYRRESMVVRVALCAVALLLSAILLTHAMDGNWSPRATLTWDGLGRSLAQVGCLLWGSGESLRYWVRMRRRQKIGLADSVVVNRFLMWGLGSGLAGLGTGVGVAAEVLTGIPSLQIPWVVSTSSASGFCAAVAIYLAFIPPERYVRFIQARA